MFIQVCGLVFKRLSMCRAAASQQQPLWLRLLRCQLQVLKLFQQLLLLLHFLQLGRQAHSWSADHQPSGTNDITGEWAHLVLLQNLSRRLLLL